MKQVTKKANEEGKFAGYCGGIACVVLMVMLFVIFYIFMEKWGCEHKKAKGFAGYQNREC